MTKWLCVELSPWLKIFQFLGFGGGISSHDADLLPMNRLTL
jgi:hypothetical protein